MSPLVCQFGCGCCRIQDAYSAGVCALALKLLPKEQQEQLAGEVRARYPNLFALAEKLQANPQAQALARKAL